MHRAAEAKAEREEQAKIDGMTITQVKDYMDEKKGTKKASEEHDKEMDKIREDAEKEFK